MSHHHKPKPRIDRVVIGVLFVLAIYVAVIWSILNTKPRHIFTRPQAEIATPPEPAKLPDRLGEQASVARENSAAEITAKPSDSNDLPTDSRGEEITQQLRGGIDLPEVHNDPVAVDAGEPVATSADSDGGKVDLPGVRGRVPHHRHRVSAPPVAVDPDVPDFPAWMTPGTFN